MGLDPGSPGSHPGSKAGAKPLNHPGCPLELNLMTLNDTNLQYSEPNLVLAQVG